jgi:hypothetical protein
MVYTVVSEFGCIALTWKLFQKPYGHPEGARRPMDLCNCREILRYAQNDVGADARVLKLKTRIRDHTQKIFPTKNRLSFRQAQIEIEEFNPPALGAAIDIERQHVLGHICPFAQEQMPAAAGAACPNRQLAE